VASGETPIDSIDLVAEKEHFSRQQRQILLEFPEIEALAARSVRTEGYLGLIATGSRKRFKYPFEFFASAEDYFRSTEERFPDGRAALFTSPSK